MAGLRYQPQGAARLSQLAVLLGFTHVFNFGDGRASAVNLVTGKPGISVASGASIIGGPGGRASQLTGTLGDRLEVAGNPFATSTGTYLWIDSGVDPGTMGQAVIHTKYGTTATGASGEQFGLQIRIIGDTINILSAQIANRATATGRDNTGGLNCSAVSVAGDAGRHAVFNRGRLLYGATPASTGFTPNYQHGISAIGGAYDCTSSTVKYYALFFAPKALSDDALKFLTANPWLLFQDPHDDDPAAATRAYTLLAAAGSFSTSGAAASILAIRKIAVATATFALGGIPAALKAARKLVGSPATYVLSGSPLQALVARRIAAEPNALAIVGAPAGLRAARRVSANPGAFKLSAFSVQMTYLPAPGPGGPTYTLTSAPGFFGLAGTATALQVRRRMAAAPGSMALTGSATALVARRRLAAAVGGYALQGLAVQVRAARRIVVQAGAFDLAVGAALLKYTSSGQRFDISKIHPSRLVIFDGSGSRVTPFDGSGSRVTRFE